MSNRLIFMFFFIFVLLGGIDVSLVVVEFLGESKIARMFGIMAALFACENLHEKSI